MMSLLSMWARRLNSSVCWVEDEEHVADETPRSMGLLGSDRQIRHGFDDDESSDDDNAAVQVQGGFPNPAMEGVDEFVGFGDGDAEFGDGGQGWPVGEEEADEG